MFNRFCFGALLLACLALTFTGCNATSGLTTIVISPSSYTAVASPYGDTQVTTNYKAIGYYGHADHQTTKDITDQVTWTSYTPNLVTISSSGVATVTGEMYGDTQIIASAPGYNGDIVSNASTFTVSAPNSSTNSDIVSITITPSSPTFASTGLGIGFSAIGTTGTGTQVDVTAVSKWTSSNTSVATIGAKTGTGTTVGAGVSTITATYTNSNDGIMVTAYTVLTVQ
jgi:hypothetical protein